MATEPAQSPDDEPTTSTDPTNDEVPGWARTPGPRTSGHQPSPPIAGIRLMHSRRWSGMHRQRRVALQVERDQLLTELDQLDGEIDQLTKRRLAALAGIDERREQLWPPVPHHKGRRPPAVGERPIPPAQPDARAICGRALRETCRSLLRRHGPLPLREIHTWLHHYGYVIAHPYPVKALSDTLRWEVTQGRLQRVQRAVYAIAAEETTTKWFRGLEPPLRDPWLDQDQPSWSGNPGFLAPRDATADPFAPMDEERERRRNRPDRPERSA